jgi:hypothetical protein
MDSTVKRRGGRSCNRCTSRKIKCSGEDTCEQCVKSSTECIYRQTKKRGPPKGCPPRGGYKRNRSSPPAPSPPLHPPVSAEMLWDTSELHQPAAAHYANLSHNYNRDQEEWDEGMHQAGTSYQDSASPASPLSTIPSSLKQSLIEIYLAFIHPHWPVIYLPRVRDLRNLETQEPILFEAIMAIAATTFDPAVDQKYNLSFSPHVASVDMVESVRTKIWQDRLQPKLSTIQALILLTVLDLGYGRSSFAYQYGGIACRMALDMRLHEADCEKVVPEKVQERLRVIWACYILDKILAAVLQRPVMMRREDLDVPFPDIMERDEFDLYLAGPTRRFISEKAHPSMERTKVHCLSSFQAWANLMYILERILRNVYSRWAMHERKRGANLRYDETLAALDGDLQRWREELPSHLQWLNDHSGVGPHVLTLRGWYYASLLLLHRPRLPRLEETIREKAGASAHLSGVDICKRAATQICCLMETYEGTFRVRKIPSSWVFLIFQGGIIHSSFSAPNGRTSDHLSASRKESAYRLQQCIKWLGVMSKTWTSASHHVETLKDLQQTSSVTRPASPVHIGMPRLLEDTLSAFPVNYEASAGWQAFWNEMPTSSEDVALWESFSVLFNQ